VTHIFFWDIFLNSFKYKRFCKYFEYKSTHMTYTFPNYPYITIINVYTIFKIDQILFKTQNFCDMR